MAEVIAGGCRRTDDEIGSMSDKPKDTGGKLLYFPRQEENRWLVDRSGCQHPRWHRVTSAQLFETGVRHSSTELERSVELGQSAIGSSRTALWCRSASLMILAATLVHLQNEVLVHVPGGTGYDVVSFIAGKEDSGQKTWGHQAFSTAICGSDAITKAVKVEGALVSLVRELVTRFRSIY
ncbi:hypothetical protein BDR06DRAFT_976930 [Suillus hirtellus]|nr:hypothetical protein BDR06DRAFT_976930 [Suillus hirtellus]